MVLSGLASLRTQARGPLGPPASVRGALKVGRFEHKIDDVLGNQLSRPVNLLAIGKFYMIYRKIR